MLGIGLYMVGLPKGLAFKSSLINFHKSLGMTVFLLVLIRIVVRLVAGRPPLPPMQAWQRAAASMTQGLLYVAMIVMPLTGYLGSSFNKFGTHFWGILLPMWLGRRRLAQDFIHAAYGQRLGADRADRAACGGRAQTSVDRPRPPDGEDAAMTSITGLLREGRFRRHAA
jgi:cytochrome b561